MQLGMNPTVLVILLACAMRLVFAASTGLGIDESYMVAASGQFDASYFDHPLASWWLELGSRFIFGNAAPLVVRLPFRGAFGGFLLADLSAGHAVLRGQSGVLGGGGV